MSFFLLLLTYIENRTYKSTIDRSNFFLTYGSSASCHIIVCTKLHTKEKKKARTSKIKTFLHSQLLKRKKMQSKL